MMEGFHDNLFSFIPDIESAESVPVVQADNLDEDNFLKNWVENNKPCLIKGAIRHWPAISKWRNKEYWITECANFEVQVFMHNNFLNLNAQESDRDDMLFHDAIKRLFENRDYILSMPSEPITVNNGLANVEKDLGRFNFLNPNLKPRVYWNKRLFIYRRASIMAYSPL